MSASVGDEVDSDDNDTPQLSAHTLSALQEFYAEQNILKELLEKSSLSNDPDKDLAEADETLHNSDSTKPNSNGALFSSDLNKHFPEDWVGFKERAQKFSFFNLNIPQFAIVIYWMIFFVKL